ncbi:MAG: hypothetical protein ACK8QZ_12570 [Anaerolineales bacterium]
MSSEVRYRQFFARLTHAFLITFVWETVLRRIGRFAVSLGATFTLAQDEPECSGKSASTIGLLLVLVTGLALAVAVI